MFLFHSIKCLLSRHSIIKRSRQLCSQEILSTIQKRKEENDWMHSLDGQTILYKAMCAPIPNPPYVTSKNIMEYISLRYNPNNILNLPEDPVDLSNQLYNTISSKPSTPIRILSDLLTYPLTITYGLSKVHKFSQWMVSKENEILRISILGARAEASLPMQWLQEIILSSHFTWNLKTISLYFLGPDVMIDHNFSSSKSVTIGQTTLEMRNDSHANVTLHCHPKYMEIIHHTDIFVLFNPGYGSNATISKESITLKQSWDETLSLLVNSRKPVIVTALSEYDVRRDLKVLGERFEISEIGERQKNHLYDDYVDIDGEKVKDCIEMIVEPHINPYQSYKYIIDEKEDMTHQIVAKNQYIYIWQGQ